MSFYVVGNTYMYENDYYKTIRMLQFDTCRLLPNLLKLGDKCFETEILTKKSNYQKMKCLLYLICSVGRS